MKKIYFITLALLFLLTDVSGQGSALILTKRKNGVERTYYDGKTVKALMMNGEVFKGNLAIVNATYIAIGPDTIKLSEVERLRIRTDANYIFGGLITGAGVLGTTLGIALITESSTVGGYAAFFGIVFGLPIATVGVLVAGTGLVVILAGKKYTRYKWQYSVYQVAHPGH